MRNPVAVAVLLLLACSAAAETLPKAPDRHVTDRAGVLNQAETDELERMLTRLETDGLAQTIVYLDRAVPSSEPSLEAYTLRLANAWGVGSRKRNDGVVIFVFMNDRRMRIEVGLGLEKVLTDDVARKIIDGDLKPAFREGRFGEGLKRAIESIRRTLERAER